jgi:replicative DNA helicase
MINVPHSLEAEQGLLCSCAIDPIYVMPLIKSASLTKDHFYDESHKIFYECLMDLWDNNLPMQFITIVRNLECNHLLDRVGGRPAVSQLLTFIPTAGHASVYIDHLMEDYNKRMLLSLYHQGINSILEPGACVKSCLHYSIDKLNDVIKYDVPDESYHNQISNTMKDVEQRIKNKAPIGISTGFKNLDQIIGGLEPDNLYIIGARPGSGKTAMLANIITHICSLNKPCAFFLH